MWLKCAFVIFVSFIFVWNAAADESSSLKQDMINRSIAAYHGKCPCPYNLKSNGQRCGKSSAWSKRGGEKPLCYESDISEQMLNAYKKNYLKY